MIIDTEQLREKLEDLMNKNNFTDTAIWCSNYLVWLKRIEKLFIEYFKDT